MFFMNHIILSKKCILLYYARILFGLSIRPTNFMSDADIFCFLVSNKCKIRTKVTRLKKKCDFFVLWNKNNVSKASIFWHCICSTDKPSVVRPMTKFENDVGIKMSTWKIIIKAKKRTKEKNATKKQIIFRMFLT